MRQQGTGIIGSFNNFAVPLSITDLDHRLGMPAVIGALGLCHTKSCIDVFKSADLMCLHSCGHIGYCLMYVWCCAEVASCSGELHGPDHLQPQPRLLHLILQVRKVHGKLAMGMICSQGMVTILSACGRGWWALHYGYGLWHVICLWRTSPPRRKRLYN